MKLDWLAKRWGYIWRTVVLYLMWVLLSPVATLLSAVRSGKMKGAWIRTKLVYDSVYKKFVVRPRLNDDLANTSNEDLETLIWLSQNYPVTMKEAAEIWEANGRMLGATIHQIELMIRKKDKFPHLF